MRKLGNIIFSIIGLILLYLVIGNVYRGITGVTLIGKNRAHFLGYYMIASAYFVLLVIVIVLLVLVNRKRRKKNERKS
ncbi:MAG: hypothetical protein NC182_03870 [Prevotella sp.]|nr:hypothetical protein [Staphylococcus sp.]MCM1350317.1 hypothetical protein [Prevotella sp.]